MKRIIAIVLSAVFALCSCSVLASADATAVEGWYEYVGMNGDEEVYEFTKYMLPDFYAGVATDYNLGRYDHENHVYIENPNKGIISEDYHYVMTGNIPYDGRYVNEVYICAYNRYTMVRVIWYDANDEIVAWSAGGWATLGVPSIRISDIDKLGFNGSKKEATSFKLLIFTGAQKESEAEKAADTVMFNSCVLVHTLGYAKPASDRYRYILLDLFLDVFMGRIK